jgi:hypothetical protein
LLCDDDIELHESDCLERMMDDYMISEKAKRRKGENTKIDNQVSDISL